METGFLINMVKELLAFTVIITLLVLWIELVYLRTKHKAKKQAEAETATAHKAESAAKEKEQEIEKMDAHSVASTSAKSDTLLRDKERLKREFGERADSITEDFFRK